MYFIDIDLSMKSNHFTQEKSTNAFLYEISHYKMSVKTLCLKYTALLTDFVNPRRVRNLTPVRL